MVRFPLPGCQKNGKVFRRKFFCCEQPGKRSMEQLGDFTSPWRFKKNMTWLKLTTHLGMVYATSKNGEIGDCFLFYQHYLGFKWGFVTVGK